MKQKQLFSNSPSYTRRETVFQIVFLILLVLCVSFIFYNSFLSKASSRSISVKVTEQINKVTASVGVKPATDNTIRKIAHFIEFFALGIFMFGFSASRRKNKFINAVWCAVISLLVALTDETIQVFSNRGSSVKDVWLDAISSTAAVFIFYLILFLISRKKTMSADNAGSDSYNKDNNGQADLTEK